MKEIQKTPSKQPSPRHMQTIKCSVSCCLVLHHPFPPQRVAANGLFKYILTPFITPPPPSLLIFNLTSQVPEATVSYNSCKSITFSISLLKKLQKEILLDWNLNLTLCWPCRGHSRSNSSRFSFYGYKF